MRCLASLLLCVLGLSAINLYANDQKIYVVGKSLKNFQEAYKKASDAAVVSARQNNSSKSYAVSTETRLHCLDNRVEAGSFWWEFEIIADPDPQLSELPKHERCDFSNLPFGASMKLLGTRLLKQSPNAFPKAQKVPMIPSFYLAPEPNGDSNEIKHWFCVEPDRPISTTALSSSVGLSKNDRFCATAIESFDKALKEVQDNFKGYNLGSKKQAKWDFYAVPSIFKPGELDWQVCVSFQQLPLMR